MTPELQGWYQLQDLSTSDRLLYTTYDLLYKFQPFKNILHSLHFNQKSVSQYFQYQMFYMSVHLSTTYISGLNFIGMLQTKTFEL